MLIEITPTVCGHTEMRSHQGRPPKYCLACRKMIERAMQRAYHRRERKAKRAAERPWTGELVNW